MRIKIDPIIAFALGIIFGLVIATVFNPLKAGANTVFQTNQPNSNAVLISNSLDSLNTTVIKLPVGISFNRVQLPVNNAGSFYFFLRNDPLGNTFNCNLVPISDCLSDDAVIGTIPPPTIGAFINDNLREYSLNETFTITSPNQYFSFEYNVNTTQTSGIRLTNKNNGFSYSYNNYIGITSPPSNLIATILCLNSCNNNGFVPLPTLTVDPWARLVSATPQTNSFSTIDLGIQINTGTSTADNAIVRYISNFQTIVSDSLQLTTTGLNSFNLIKNFPAISDTVLMNITLYNGTSTAIYASPDYEIQIVPNSNNLDPNGIDCESLNILARPFCNALVYLFMPNENSFNRFNDLYSELDTIKPFGYFTTALSTLQGVSASSTPAYTMPEIPFIDTIFTPLKTGVSILLWGVFLFVFYNKRLKNIDI